MHACMQARAQPAALAVPPSQLQPLSLWQKLVPLAIIFFCASFNLTLLANLKVCNLGHALTLRPTSPCAWFWGGARCPSLLHGLDSAQSFQHRDISLVLRA